MAASAPDTARRDLGVSSDCQAGGAAIKEI
jgi:hypothetical protein